MLVARGRSATGKVATSTNWWAEVSTTPTAGRPGSHPGSAAADDVKA
jgi:hypothetical protein